MDSGLLSLSLLIAAVEVIAVAAIAAVSLRGYRKFGSRTLLYLSISFFLIALGIILSYISGLYQQEIIALFGSIAESAGYFVLALSHVYTVRGSMLSEKPAALFTLALPGIMLLNTVARSISFFLLLYIFAETVIFSIQYRSRASIFPAIGFLLLIFATYYGLFLSSLNLLYIQLEVIKLLAYFILAAPLLIFAIRGEQVEA